MKKLIKNFLNSLAGIKTALGDSSFRMELYLGVALMPIIWFADTTKFWQKLALIGTYLLLLSFELLNTAIERLCDRITKEYDEDIKAVKDIASAAVFFVLLILLGECVLLSLPS